MFWFKICLLTRLSNTPLSKLYPKMSLIWKECCLSFKTEVPTITTYDFKTRSFYLPKISLIIARVVDFSSSNVTAAILDHTIAVLAYRFRSKQKQLAGSALLHC